MNIKNRAPERKDTNTLDILNEVKNEVKKNSDTIGRTFEEFKTTNDQRLSQLEEKSSADVVTVEKLNRIEASLKNYDDLNQKMTTFAASQKAIEDVNKATDALLAKIQSKMGRPNTGGSFESKSRVNDWARGVVDAHLFGTPNLNAEQVKVLGDVAAEYKALNVSADSAGGYLSPIEYVNEILKGITDISPVRSVVKIRRTSNKAYQQPKRTGQFAARRVGEQEQRSETLGLTYGLDELPLPEVYALIDISQQMLEDSAFDMEHEIKSEAEEQFAVKEGAEFISGTGVGMMEGILVAAGISENVSGTATSIADSTGQANGLITMVHSLKTGYAKNAKFLLNRRTLGSIRKMKDSQGEYIWVPGIAGGLVNTILGDPYVEMPDMPDEGAGTYPIVYGDFMRAYTLADRVSAEMLRDPYTQATSGNIRFIFRRRMSGKVFMGEAFRKLKCST